MTQFVTDAFADLFCRRLQVHQAVAVNNGRAALIAALWSLVVCGKEWTAGVACTIKTARILDGVG